MEIKSLVFLIKFDLIEAKMSLNISVGSHYSSYTGGVRMASHIMSQNECSWKYVSNFLITYDILKKFDIIKANMSISRFLRAHDSS